MKREANDHPKLWDLVDALPEPYNQRGCAVGYLELVWHFAAKFSAPGNIGSRSDAAIARWVGWPLEPALLIDALVESGWLDRDEHYRLVVHGWAEHADDAVHRQLARSRQWFADGAVPNWKRLNPEEREKAEQFYKEHRPTCAHRAEIAQPDVRPTCAHDAHGGREPRPAPPRPASARAEDKASSTSPPAQPSDSAWESVREAFGAYGKSLRGAPSPARQRALRARARESSAESLASAVHGYWALHAGSRSNGFDASKHFTPETVFRPGTFPKYLEAYEEALARGREPPFREESAEDKVRRLLREEP